MKVPLFLGQPTTPDELDELLRSARAEGFKAGQEAMRERAAQHAGYMRWDGKDMWVKQDAILALSIQEAV